METATELRLNLGAGDIALTGYTPVDRKLGSECYPLAYPDESADEIRASHILEHFPHRTIENVLRDWVRVLKPNGVLKIAVPNLEYIAKGYLAGEIDNWGGYLMGGQDDANDFHYGVFDETHLRVLFERVGLKDIQTWKSEIEDCAALPVSLNLQGRKPGIDDRRLPNMRFVMTMPRLAFSDNMFCALQVSAALSIPFTKTTGAFWGQCMERGLAGAVADGAEYIITADYDSIFTVEDLLRLCDYMRANPDMDAICPVQVKRGENNFLMGMLDDEGKPFAAGTKVSMGVFSKPFTRLGWGHFGLTILKASALKKVAKPWIWCEPNKDGEWDEGRIDEDIYFWRKWNASGNNFYMANRVAIGHAQLGVYWPAEDGGVIHQYMEKWGKEGRPYRVWR